MQPFETSELKALFGQLVESVGTQEAAATFLGVSRQRVGQLISSSCPDLPTWPQVWKLEQVCGVSVVFAALGRKVEARGRLDALEAGLATTAASADFCRALHLAHSDGIIDARERDSLLSKARASMEAAQMQYDAARALHSAEQPAPRPARAVGQ